MKGTFIAAGALMLALLVGCTNGTPGGPGADKDKDSKVKLGDDTFSLSVPTLASKIKQGESKVVDIEIKRGKNFSQDITLKLDGVPKGVTIEPAAPAIKAGDKEVKLTVKAADDAAIGEHTVKVVGHPGKGVDATNELKLTIEKK